jgi:hypothetical protein
MLIPQINITQVKAELLILNANVTSVYTKWNCSSSHITTSFIKQSKGAKSIDIYKLMATNKDSAKGLLQKQLTLINKKSVKLLCWFSRINLIYQYVYVGYMGGKLTVSQLT